MTLRMQPWVTVAVAIFAATSVRDAGRSEDAAGAIPIIDQSAYSESVNGCGPASILNLLRFSDPPVSSAFERILGRDDEVRMRYVIDRYFRNRPSSVRRGRRWGVHGVESEDLLLGLNELLDEHGIDPVRGGYLDREENETEAELLERVHRRITRSLGRGVKPILSLRSFVVSWSDEGEPGWRTGRHHNVVVIGAPEKISPTGFELEVLDPWKAARRTVYVHVEPGGRAFRALRGNEETGEWLDGRPFLQVVAPGMSSLWPRDLEWSERYLVTANYLIGAF